MLLVHDGLDTKYNDAKFWTQLDPEDNDDDNEEHIVNVENVQEEIINIHHNLCDPETFSYALSGPYFKASEQYFDIKIDYLIKHHSKQYQMGLVLWPKSVPKMLKQAMTYRQRASEFIYNSLYMKKSSFIGFKFEALGYGLFSNIDIEVGTTIGRYKGEFISTEEKNRRIR
jgi:hypothetical protein